MRRGSIVLSLFFLALVPISVFADDSDRGRLPDGRAFRKDGGGNEIVDYIAELEVANEGLLKKIRQLEGDLRDHQGQVEKAAACPVCADPPREKVSQKSDPIVCPVADCSDDTQRVRDGVTSEFKEREAKLIGEITTLRQSVTALKQELERKENLLRASYTNQQERSEEESGKEVASLKIKVSTLDSELQSRNGEIDELLKKITSESDARERAEREITKLQDSLSDSHRQAEKSEEVVKQYREQLASLKEESASKSERNATLDSSVAMLKKEVEIKDTKLQETLRELEDQKKQVALLTSVAPAKAESVHKRERVVVADEEAPPPDLSAAKAKAIESLKVRLAERLSEVKKVVAERDVLFERYEKRPHRVSFPHTRVLSSRGLGPKEIEGRLRAITSAVELSALSRDISELESKAQEDIALVERMSKAR